MKTRFRLLTIIFSFGMISAFGWFDFIVFKIASEKNDFGTWQIIGIIFFTLFVLAGLISIQRLSKTIRFENDRMIVNWIFRKKRLEYNFNDISGFIWSSLNGSFVNYKQIIIYTSDKKSIGFSDFEYGNFYDLENFIKNKFVIFHSYTQKASKEQKEIAFKESCDFDREQVKMINFALYSLWVLIGLIFWMTIKDLNSMTVLSNGRFIIILFTVLILLLSIRKYINEKERKK